MIRPYAWRRNAPLKNTQEEFFSNSLSFDSSSSNPSSALFFSDDTDSIFYGNNDDDCSIEVTEEEYSSTSAWDVVVRQEGRGDAVPELLEIVHSNRKRNHNIDRGSLSLQVLTTLVNILWQSVGHARTQTIGCQVLQQLALVEAPNRSRMLQAGAGFVLHFAMLHHPFVEPLQECALTALELLAQTSKHRFMLKRLSSWESLLDTIFVALEFHADHSAITRRALGLLLHLSKTDNEVSECIVDKGGVQRTVKTWKQYQKYPPIANISLELLQRLISAHPRACSSNVNTTKEIILTAVSLIRDKMLQAEGVDMLARLAMVDFQSMQWECTTIFAKELDQSTDLGLQAGQQHVSNDALEGHVFAMMNERNKRPYLQKTSSLVAKRVGGHTGLINSIVSSPIVEADGLTAVIAAMNVRQDNANLLMNALIVLGSVTVAEGASVSLLVDAGALEAIAAAMKAHPDHEGVQKNGCVSLANLWASATNSTTSDILMTSADGVQAVITAMQGHAERVEVQLIGCRALLYFAIGCEKQNPGTPCVWLGKIVGAVLLAMHRFTRDSNVQEVGCKALANVAACSAGRCAIHDACGLNKLLQVLEDEGGNAKELVAGCTALLNLSVSRTCCEEMVNAGVPAALFRLIDKPTSYCNVVELVLLILHNLYLVCITAATTGMSAALQQCMGQRGYSPRIQAFCLDALWALVLNARSQDVVSRGCVDLIVSMMTTGKFKDICRVQTRGHMVLATLAEAGMVHSVAPALANRVDTLMSVKTNNKTRLCYSWRLLSVVAKESGKPESISEATVVAVIARMREFNQHPRLQFFGTSVLAVSYNLNAERSSATSTNAVDVMASAVSSLNAFPNGGGVAVLKVVRDLAALVTIRKRITLAEQSTAFNDILSAMNSHPLCLCMQELGCSILYKLSQSPEGRQHLNAAFAEPTIISAMNRHRPSIEIQQFALMLLVYLCQPQKATTDEVASAVAKTMIFHRSATKVQTLGCIVLSKVSTKLSQSETELVADALSMTLIADPTNSVIQRYGGRTLENLNACNSRSRCGVESHPFFCTTTSTSLITEVAVPFLALWLIESYWGHFHS